MNKVIINITKGLLVGTAALLIADIPMEINYKKISKDVEDLQQAYIDNDDEFNEKMESLKKEVSELEEKLNKVKATL